jgi:hypothetical protein
MTKMKTMVQFTKRTNDPKLSWLEDQLDKAGIEYKREGESFHAPILYVEESREDDAWAILNPVDDIPDDDPQFLHDVFEMAPFSLHPSDSYLSIVLCRIDNDFTPFVTWIYNRNDRAFYHGHYFQHESDARKDFEKRKNTTIPNLSFNQ